MVEGFALGGARVFPATDPAQVRAAWQALPATVAIVILTRAAGDALREMASPTERLRVVMPQ